MKEKPTATSNRKLDLGRKEGIFLWNTVMQAKIWGKPPTKEKQAREEDMKPPVDFSCLLDSLQLFQKSTVWQKHPKLYPCLSGFLGHNVPHRITVDLRRSPSADGRARKPVTSPSPTSMTWARSSYSIAKWGCYLKAICHRVCSFLLVVPWRTEKLYVIASGNKEERVEKNPMTFCFICCLRKHMLSAVRPHSMLILKAYMQKFETGGFVDPGRKSRFQTEAQEEKSVVPSVFVFALLINGCSLPVSWFCPAHLLNLHKLYFWAIIISRPGHRVGS